MMRRDIPSHEAIKRGDFEVYETKGGKARKVYSGFSSRSVESGTSLSPTAPPASEGGESPGRMKTDHGKEQDGCNSTRS